MYRVVFQECQELIFFFENFDFFPKMPQNDQIPAKDSGSRGVPA